jgi:HEAT repeat protein
MIDMTLDESIKNFGPNPADSIISNVVANSDSDKVIQMSAMMLAYIGSPATLELIPLLGHKNPIIARFAAKTLAAIDGSLKYVIVALKEGDERTRLNAAGCLQFYGYRAKPALDTMLSVLKLEDSEEIAGVLSAAIGKIGEVAAAGLWKLYRDETKKSIRVRGILGLSRVGKPALKYFYEIRQIETDREVLDMVEYYISDLIGESKNDLILPEGSGVLVDIVKGISMNPVKISKSTLKQMHKLAYTELKPGLVRLQNQAKVSPSELVTEILQIAEDKGLSFLSELLDNKDSLIRRIAGDCLAVAGKKAIPFLITNLGADNLDRKESASGALLRLIYTSPQEDFQDAIPALQDMIVKGSLKDWTATVIAAASLADAGEIALPTIKTQ